MPMVEGNGDAESIFSQGYKYTFGVLAPAQNYLRGVIDLSLAQDPKPTSVGVLSADDPFSVDIETPAVATISLYAAAAAVLSLLPSALFALAT